MINLTTDTVVRSVNVTGKPAAMAYVPSTGLVYIANAGSNNFDLFSPANDSLAGVVAAGYWTWGVVYDPLLHVLFFTAQGNNLVLPYNLINGTWDPVISTGNLPTGIAFDPANDTLYVSNWLDNTVSVLQASTGTTLKTINVGTTPDGVVYDSQDGKVFVSDYGAQSVSVIRVANNSVVATVPVGTDPSGLGYNPTNDEVVVQNGGSDNVSLISAATDTVVATVQSGTNTAAGAYTLQIAVDAVTEVAYSTSAGTQNVTLIDVARGIALQTIAVGGVVPTVIGAGGSAYAAYVSIPANNTLATISGSTHQVSTYLPVGPAIWGSTYDTGDGLLYFTSTGAGAVDAVNGSTGLLVQTAFNKSMYYPEGIGYDPTLNEFFVANYGSPYTVGVFNGSTYALVPDSYPSQTSAPAGLAYDPLDGDVYVANTPQYYVNGQYAYWLAVEQASTQNQVGFYNLGHTSSPNNVVYAPADKYVYVTFPGGNEVMVFNASGNLATLATGVDPAGICYDSGNGYVYVTNELSDTVTVISGLTDIGNITVGVDPQGCAYDGTGGDLYVTDSGNSGVSLIPTSATLTAVTVSPSSDTLQVGAYANFTATPSCTGGSCSGVTFSWSRNNTALGNLNTTSGPSVKFTAIAKGIENLSVVAMLNGQIVKNSSVITITTATVPTLAYVSLTPLTATVNASGTQAFTATVGCSGGSCPPGAIFTWGLNNSLGKLNATSGPQVLFTANSTAGLVNLTVTAHLNGKTATNSSAITITKSSPPPSTYAVTFGETGLPGGTNWSVTIGGATLSSTTSTIAFTESNGTYAYTVGAVSGYTASPSSGNVTVKGASQAVSTTFKPDASASYTFTFTESGLPSGSNWSVTLGTTTLSSVTSSVVFSETNNTYTFSVGAVPGYTASPSTGSVTVAGKPVSKTITFTKVSTGPTKYAVTFTEGGLSPGTSWSVTLNGSTQGSTGTTISLQEVNGSYAFTVGTVSGYTASPSSGSLKVNGETSGQKITFTSSSSKGKTNQTTGFLGLPGYYGYIVIGAVAAVAAIAAAVLLTRHRTKKPKQTPVETGGVITNPSNNQQTNVILKDN
jgi:YVTN family beta-propeller protein